VSCRAAEGLCPRQRKTELLLQATLSGTVGFRWEQRAIRKAEVVTTGVAGELWGQSMVGTEFFHIERNMLLLNSKIKGLQYGDSELNLEKTSKSYKEKVFLDN